MTEEKNLLKSILMIVLFYLINFGAWDWVVNNGWLAPPVASLADYFLLFVIALLLFRKELKLQWKAFKEAFNGKFIGKIILCAVLGVILSNIFVYLGSRLFPDAGGTQNQENLNKMSQALPPSITFIMMAVFAPVIEELTFRHSFLASVPKGHKLLLVVLTILSVIAFDKIHIADPFSLPAEPIEFFYYLGLTLALTGFYFYGKRNVCYSICLHAFLNASGFLLMSLGII